MVYDKAKRSHNETFKFTDVGGDNTAVRVSDVSQASNQLSISAESITFSAGAAGTTGVVAVDKAPIYNSTGDRLGELGNTSFAFVTGTVLTTEVAINVSVSDAVQLASMSNGEYAINYDSGLIRYKKATTGTSDTCNYTTRQTNIQVTTAAAAASSLEGDVAHDAVDSGNPVKVGGYAIDPTSLPSAVAAGDRVNQVNDTYGRPVVYLGTSLDATNDEVSVTPRDHSNINTTAYAASLVVKASAGKLFEIRGYNSSASAQFIQVHDAASLPADTAVPEEVITVPASSNFSITFPPGKSFGTGIVVCNSSTGPTKTIGSADCWISADFE